MSESFGSKPLTLPQGEAPRAQGLDHPRIVARIDHHRDARVILGGSTDHRRPTDIDLLDAFIGTRTRCHRAGEGVEVDDDEIEGGNAELLELLDVIGQAHVREEPRVDTGMQGLDPAVQAFGEAGEIGDRRDRDA